MSDRRAFHLCRVAMRVGNDTRFDDGICDELVAGYNAPADTMQPQFGADGFRQLREPRVRGETITVWEIVPEQRGGEQVVIHDIVCNNDIKNMQLVR